MQKSIRTGLNRPSTILLAILAALLGYQTFAFRPAAQLGPASVATVNLQNIFSGLKEKNKEDEDLKKLAADLNEQAAAREKELKQIEADMKDHLPGSPKYQELEKKGLLAAQQYQSFIEFCKAKIDVEKGRTLRRIYLNIKKAAQQLADSNGYDIVFVDDSQAEIPTGGEDDTNRQISARRMLYSSKRIDITDDVLKAMNDNFAGPAGAAAGAAPAANPGATPPKTAGATPAKNP